LEAQQMNELENELGLANWLSIVSFDLHKYIKAGGKVIISDDENGLIVQFVGVALGDSRLHRKFNQVTKEEVEQ
jgi:hypothetical protein